MRLVSIAGAEAGEPLWTRPFRRNHPTGCVPRRAAASKPADPGPGDRCRRGPRKRRGRGQPWSGYAAAPSAAVASVSDPGAEARAAFSSTLGQSPLSSDVLGAVISPTVSDLGATTAPVGKAPTVAAGAALGADAALDSDALRGGRLGQRELRRSLSGSPPSGTAR